MQQPASDRFYLYPMSGVADLDALKLLREIYDDYCLQHGFHCGSGAAEDLAKKTMELFGQGALDEAEIRENLDTYFRRKSATGDLLRQPAQD